MSYRDKGVALYKSPIPLGRVKDLPRAVRSMLRLCNQRSKAILCGAPRENSGIFALCGATPRKATLPKLEVDTFYPIGEKRELSRSQIAVPDFK